MGMIQKEVKEVYHSSDETSNDAVAMTSSTMLQQHLEEQQEQQQIEAEIKNVLELLEQKAQDLHNLDSILASIESSQESGRGDAYHDDDDDDDDDDDYFLNDSLRHVVGMTRRSQRRTN